MYKIYSVNALLNESNVQPSFNFETFQEVKDWFFFQCNIPSNWIVITPTEEWLEGRYYNVWKYKEE